MSRVETERYYTHEYRLEMLFSVPHCLSGDSTKTLEEEREWVVARMMLALSDVLQSESGIADILFHEGTIKE